MEKILNGLKFIYEKEYVQIDDKNETDFLSVTYGVPQV